MNVAALDGTRALDEAVASIGSPERIILCGPPEEEALLRERLVSADTSPEEIIAASLTINVEAWFREQREELESEWNEDLEENEGEWPGDDVPKQAFTGTTDIGTGKPLDQVIGVRLPLQASWQIPAHLQIGGWNDCPDPEVHCAIWRYWETKYGAAIISVSNDVVEAYVANPPATPEEALALAWQQYLYCYDIVDQGTETIANLAAGLMNHHYWFFWWD